MENITQTFRQVIDAEQISTFVNLPAAMRHGLVEITVVSLQKPVKQTIARKTKPEVLRKIWEITKGRANAALIPLEKTAWSEATAENAVSGKYAPKF